MLSFFLGTLVGAVGFVVLVFVILFGIWALNGFPLPDN